MGRPKKQQPQDEAQGAVATMEPEEKAVDPAQTDELKAAYVNLLNEREQVEEELNGFESKKRFMEESVGDEIKRELKDDLDSQIHAVHKEMETCEPSALRMLQGRISAYYEQKRRIDGANWDDEILAARKKITDINKRIADFRENNALFMPQIEGEEIGDLEEIGLANVDSSEPGIADAIPTGTKY